MIGNKESCPFERAALLQYNSTAGHRPAVLDYIYVSVA
jgi:hypothetical protein